MEKLSIIVPAHDSYGDIVEVFEKCFKAQWPDCPYDVYWANGTRTISSDVIKVINCGEEASFCKRILCALDQIETKYVLIWVEDFLPTRRIDTAEIERLLDYMDRHESRHCCLLKEWKNAMKRTEDPQIYIQDPDRPYSVSFSLAVFRPDYIRELVKDENWLGWDVESYGLDLAKQGLNTGCLYYDIDLGGVVHLISHGKMFPSAVKALKKYGVDISGVKRGSISRWDEVEMLIKKTVGFFVPSSMRVKMKKLGRKLGFKFVSDN